MRDAVATIFMVVKITIHKDPKEPRQCQSP